MSLAKMSSRMHNRRAAGVFFAAALFVCLAANAAPIYESGILNDEIARLKTLILPQQSGRYVAPTTQNLADFRVLADSVRDGQIWQASLQADAIGYEMVVFTDTRDDRSYWLLREKLNVQGQVSKGWGSYIYDRLEVDNLLVETPHPLFDTDTPRLAIEVFYESNAKGFLMTGAHRNQDGSTNGIANVAGNANTIFNIVHQEWSDAGTLPLQIHGFDWDLHTNFPANCEVVLSNGNGAVPQPHIALDAAFDAAGIQCYVYTSSAPASINALVNYNPATGLVVSGGTFSSLNANYNVQGQYTRNTYGMPFVHCELEQSVRYANPGKWEPAVDALVATFGETIPEPLTAVMIAVAAASLAGLTRRRRAIKHAG